MTTNPFLADGSLQKFIDDSQISDETKSFLLSKLPEMDENERLEVMDFLQGIYSLELEKVTMIERVKTFEKTGKFE